MSQTFPQPPESGDGLVIAIEGIDGAGTTTQADLLVERLSEKGISVTRTQEPSNGLIGRTIRESLRQSDPARHVDPAGLALLFAADRLEHANRVVKPALARGEIVVTDRSVLSSLAYQGMELEESWVAAINAHSTLPHVCVWIDVPAALSMERIASREGVRERYEHADLLERLAKRYKKITEMNLPGALVIRVDGTRDIPEVADSIWSTLEASGCFRA